MGARQRLNSLYLIVTLIVAALSGGALQSWSVFWLVLGALVVIFVHGGDIRPNARRTHRHRRH